MFKVRLSPLAVSDLRNIAQYIALDNPVRAISFITELENKTTSFLETAPLGGVQYKDQTRYFPVGNYIVLYEVDEMAKLVDVLHIVNARTNWKKPD